MQVFILVWDDGMTLDPTATVKWFMIYIGGFYPNTDG